MKLNISQKITLAFYTGAILLLAIASIASAASREDRAREQRAERFFSDVLSFEEVRPISESDSGSYRGVGLKKRVTFRALGRRFDVSLVHDPLPLEVEAKTKIRHEDGTVTAGFRDFRTVIYTGTLKSDPGAFVRLYERDGAWIGSIETDDETYMIRPRSWYDGSAPVGDAFVYKHSDTEEARRSWQCGGVRERESERESPNPGHQNQYVGISQGGDYVLNGDQKQVSVRTYIDQWYWIGMSENEAIIADQVNDTFLRIARTFSQETVGAGYGIGIYRAGTTILETMNTDDFPLTTNVAGEYLDEIVACKESENCSEIDQTSDIALVLTLRWFGGAAPGSYVQGIAEWNSVCKSYGAAFAWADGHSFTRAKIVAHELAHVNGAAHDNPTDPEENQACVGESPFNLMNPVASHEDVTLNLGGCSKKMMRYFFNRIPSSCRHGLRCGDANHDREKYTGFADEDNHPDWGPANVTATDALVANLIAVAEPGGVWAGESDYYDILADTAGTLGLVSATDALAILNQAVANIPAPTRCGP